MFLAGKSPNVRSYTVLANSTMGQVNCYVNRLRGRQNYNANCYVNRLRGRQNYDANCCVNRLRGRQNYEANKGFIFLLWHTPIFLFLQICWFPNFDTNRSFTHQWRGHSKNVFGQARKHSGDSGAIVYVNVCVEGGGRVCVWMHVRARVCKCKCLYECVHIFGGRGGTCDWFYGKLVQLVWIATDSRLPISTKFLCKKCNFLFSR